MAYKQVRAFNPAKGGKIAGYCLQNTRLGFGIGSKYKNAITAWAHTQQHKDRNIPAGVDVPLYYTYKVDGHINVRLADGRVWSDGTIYKDLAAYEAYAKSAKYLGWGESVNDVRVIEYTPDPAPAPQPVFSLPAKDQVIQLLPVDVRTTFKAGTAQVAGQIKVVDDSYKYIVRGHDPVYKNRILINSASAGGNGVALALYYLSGTRIPGWKVV